MIPRQTTLCVPHFIEYAVATYSLEQESPDGKKKQAKSQSRASSATRVQPRRAAKQVRKNYVESSSESGDLNDDDDDEQHTPTSKKEKAEAAAKTVQSMLDRVTDQRPQDSTVCIFGPRPWICESCREEKATTKKSQVQYDKTDTARQPEAAMEPGMGLLPDGELLLDWSDVSVSSNSIFRLEGHHFTVDACYSPMIMRLQ
jgi:hypothetical protein